MREQFVVHELQQLTFVGTRMNGRDENYGRMIAEINAGYVIPEILHVGMKSVGMKGACHSLGDAAAVAFPGRVKHNDRFHRPVPGIQCAF